MKAKEYAEQFLDKELITQDDIVTASFEIVYAFMIEGGELQKQRNAQTEEALLAILKEQCQKWHAFANIVNKKLGESPIIRTDGFKLYLISKIPELKGKL